jgi:hypothetical protein
MYNISEDMNEIIGNSYSPPIFKVYLIKSGFVDGFEAIADFRHGHEAALESITCHANTAEAAVHQLLVDLETYENQEAV